MADLNHFLLKTNYTFEGKRTKSSMLQKIHSDNITIKHMSRDSLEALIQRQRQKTIPRSALNDTLLKNIKNVQLMTQSLTEKMSSLPDLTAAQSKISTSPFRASSALMRVLSADVKDMPHGFRYRSNGYVRSSRGNSFEAKAEKFEGINQKELMSLKQKLLKATMIHSRNADGDYMLSPMLNELVKRESRALKSKSTSETSDNLDIFRFITKDHRYNYQLNSRPESEVVFQNTNLRDKLLIGRRFLIKENDRFINSMMQHIYLLEKHSNQRKVFENQYEDDDAEHSLEIPLKGGKAFVQSEPSLMSSHNVSSRYTPDGSPIFKAKSSFNMRYGVSTQVLESRKPLLDEYMNAEMKKVSQTDIQIEKYIKEMQDVLAEKEKKQNIKVPGEDIPFDFWKTEIQAGLDLEDAATDTASPETQELTSSVQ